MLEFTKNIKHTQHSESYKNAFDSWEVCDYTCWWIPHNIVQKTNIMKGRFCIYFFFLLFLSSASAIASGWTACMLRWPWTFHATSFFSRSTFFVFLFFLFHYLGNKTDMRFHDLWIETSNALAVPQHMRCRLISHRQHITSEWGRCLIEIPMCMVCVCVLRFLEEAETAANARMKKAQHPVCVCIGCVQFVVYLNFNAMANDHNRLAENFPYAHWTKEFC